MLVSQMFEGSYSTSEVFLFSISSIFLSGPQYYVLSRILPIRLAFVLTGKAGPKIASILPEITVISLDLARLF